MMEQNTMTVTENGNAALLMENEARDFRTQWERIQAGFVDEPRQAVEEADQLAESAINRLSEVLADERAKLEREWDRGDSVSTEHLRGALRRYRPSLERPRSG